MKKESLVWFVKIGLIAMLVITVAFLVAALNQERQLRADEINAEYEEPAEEENNNCNCRSFTDGSVLVSTIGLPPPREDGKYCFDINTKEHVKCPEGMGI